jgi:signal transduction histidine kinase
LHLLGWVWPQNASEVRGVEIELAALVSRLGGAMPTEVSPGEGYALRDDKGRVQHQAGTIGDADVSVRVPLSSGLLPGWEVVAYLTASPAENGADSFFIVGALLAAVLIFAIMTSGSLLLWQARRSEAEAAQKTSFVSNVSHEFKTPLTTIRLYAELLEQGRVADAAKQGEYLRTIGRETQRLARLVNNALDFSRLEQGRKKFQPEPCDLGAELARVLAAHEPRVAEAGLTLTRALPAEPLVVTTDRDAVEQIVLNLIDNACKYAAEGRELHVTLSRRSAGGVELRVCDRGPGVPAGERERIFEKFHRIDETLTAEKSGTGLGLSIARQLARGLGGDLRCEARDGGGAEFVLTLP